MGKSEIKIFKEYFPAELRECKSGWYINYRVKNPTTGEFYRKQMRVPVMKSVTERRKYAKSLVDEINKKLYSGWNPFIESITPKGFHILINTFDIYLRAKRKELREDSIRTYSTYIGILKKWLFKRKISNIYVVDFSNTLARDFMAEQYQGDRIGERNFNNKRDFYCRFWKWLIENGYTSNNAFNGISKKIVKHKQRVQFIEAKDRIIIRDYFYNKNRRFYILAMMVYHCLIRPKEITYLKFKYINIQNQYIEIPGFFGKNKKTRYSTIPNIFMPEIEWLLSQEHKPEDYIFTRDLLRPGKKKMDTRYIRQLWEPIRKHTDIDKNIQFYSLRDTGIIQKLRDGVTPDDVMCQADHSSLEVTNKYVKIAKPRVLDKVKSLASEF